MCVEIEMKVIASFEITKTGEVESKEVNKMDMVSVYSMRETEWQV